MTKKSLLLTLNVVGLIILLFIQGLRYDKIQPVDFDKIEHGDILIKATLMTQYGIDVNWLTGLCIGFLILNGILYRQWVNSKRWILEPILILIVSFGLSITFHINRTFEISEVRFEQNN